MRWEELRDHGCFGGARWLNRLETVPRTISLGIFADLEDARGEQVKASPGCSMPHTTKTYGTIRAWRRCLSSRCVS